MTAIRETLKRRPRAALGVSAAVVLALALAWASARRARQPPLSEPLRRRTIVESVYGIGTVIANRSYQVKLGVIGSIRGVFVREGDFVRAGTPLLDLDGVTYRAPFPGTVVDLPYKVRENVSPGLPILQLVDLADRYVVVSLEQRAVMLVRRGQKARLSFESLRERSFEGTVVSVYSRESSFLVRIDPSGLPPEILPGMAADTAILTGEPREALAVPVAAVSDGRVRVRRGRGRPFPVDVRLGVIDGAYAEVVGGDLREGDRLALPAKAP